MPEYISVVTVTTSVAVRALQNGEYEYIRLRVIQYREFYVTTNTNVTMMP